MCSPAILRTWAFCAILSIAAALPAQEPANNEQGRTDEQLRADVLILEQRPFDPKANLAVGKDLCFTKGDWRRGISRLALGSEEGLSALAVRELRGPASPNEQANLGDGWWDLSDKQAKTAQRQIKAHAVDWYRKALPSLSGLRKEQVEKRLPEYESAAAAPNLANEGPPPAVAPFGEEKAKQYQAAWAKHLDAPVFIANSIGMKLVLIPPGEFMMGTPKEQVEAESRLQAGNGWYVDHVRGEGPRHLVRITKPYWLGATDVTQADYQRVMGRNPSSFMDKQMDASGFTPLLTEFQLGERPDDRKRSLGYDTRRCPVEMVSWEEAVEFCRRLSDLPGEKTAHRQYVLPTEAQWEFACRAGSDGRWCFSDPARPFAAAEGASQLGDWAWYGTNSGGKTHPVALKRPNAWGLYDMYGNVWQWCQDYYDKGYYASSATDDPAGPSGGAEHTGRGGSWYFEDALCRTSCRDYHVPSAHFHDWGFRVCKAFAPDVNDVPKKTPPEPKAAIAGMFQVTLQGQKTKESTIEFWNFAADKTVWKKDKQFATWKSQAANVVVDFLDKSWRPLVLKRKGKGNNVSFVGNYKLPKREPMSCELNPIRVIAVLHHRLWDGTFKDVALWSNGHYDAPDGADTWGIIGSQLKARGTTASGTSWGWDCTISADGQLYEGINLNKQRVGGTLISGSLRPNVK